MTRKIVSTVFLLVIMCGTLKAQEDGMLLLLIQPSAQINGTGCASVAFPTRDPLSSTLNPAHLGIQSFSSRISTGYNSTKWLTAVKTDIEYNSFAVNAGVDMRDINLDYLPISAGFGYSRLMLSYGDFVRTGPDSPDPIGTFEAYDESQQFTFSTALDYYIKLSAGITYKNVTSHYSSEVSNSLYDIGVLVDVPVIWMYEKMSYSEINFNGIKPRLNFGFGAVRSNLGSDSMKYSGELTASEDGGVSYGRSPRYARMGVSFSAGFDYICNKATLRPVLFSWSVESNEELSIKSDSLRNYKSGFGGIRLFNDLILGRSNASTENQKGWELNLFEILSISGGKFKEDYYSSDTYTTSGFAISSEGIGKLLKVMDGSIVSDNTAGYLIDKLSFEFRYSTLKAKSGSSLNGTKYYGFNLYWKMF